MYWYIAQNTWSTNISQSDSHASWFITEMSVTDGCIYSRAGDGSTLDDDTEGSGDFKAWEAKFRCTNLRTAKKHSVGQ